MHDATVGPALDHVVLAARSRADIDAQLAAMGLEAGSSRSIPGAGLSNVVVAVGTQLLELHHPDDTPIAAAAPPYARIQQEALRAHPDVALVPVAWLVRFETEPQLREASARAGYPVVAVPAEPPNDAPHLLGGLGAAFDRPWLRAFIHWSRPPHLPPTLVADHDRGPNDGHLGLDVSGPADEIATWCGTLPPDVTVEAGDAGPLRVRIHRADADPAIIGIPPADSGRTEPS
ncbi:MAG: hypothetical protein S0880_28550 [Actinomycetota bacterium]|nr:hypothetical protein [Actinomycetota bacterium]